MGVRSVRTTQAAIDSGEVVYLDCRPAPAAGVFPSTPLDLNQLKLK
jgi:hypothetical protein